VDSRGILQAGIAGAALSIASTAYAEQPLEVEVHGLPRTAAPKDVGVAGSVIGEDRLQAPGAEAGDVLRTQPGTAVADTGGYGALSTANIRGATAAQTPVYLAGVRINDDVGGAADLSLIPLWMMHRVEIYRSHAPIEGDELGIGGAVFFEPRFPKRTEAAAGALIGSYGSRGLWCRAGLGAPGAAGWIGARYDHADNDYPFVDDRGMGFDVSGHRTVRRTNADASTLDVWGVAAVQGHTVALVNAMRREQGLPGRALFPSERARGSHARDLVAVRSDVVCADGCELFTSTSALFTQATYDDPLAEIGLGTTRLDVGASRVEQALRLRWTALDRVSVTPQIRGSVERLGLDTLGQTPLRARRARFSGAATAEWRPVDVVAVRALASADCHGTTPNGRIPWAGPADPALADESACEPAARGGLGFTFGAVEILATAGRYARVPTLAEMYGVSGAVRGNAALAPEHGTSIEAGLRLSDPLGMIDLFAFRRISSDLVSYQQSSFGYVRPYNTGSAVVTGLELLGELRPARVARVELSATLLDPRSKSALQPANDILPYTSRLTLAPRFELRSKLPAHPLTAGALGVSYLYQSSRYADAAGLIVLPEQGSLDFDAEITAYEGQIALRTRVADALDRTRMDLIGYPLPGRTVHVSAELRWP
jgi:iron complex outermembrane receptor protein